MTTYSVDRCANQSCRTTIDLDWSAVACPCGAVVTCEGCDEIEACDECRTALERGDECDARYGSNPDGCHLNPNHNGPHSNKWGTTWTEGVA